MENLHQAICEKCDLAVSWIINKHLFYGSASKSTLQIPAITTQHVNRCQAMHWKTMSCDLYNGLNCIFLSKVLYNCDNHRLYTLLWKKRVLHIYSLLMRLHKIVISHKDNSLNCFSNNILMYDFYWKVPKCIYCFMLYK